MKLIIGLGNPGEKYRDNRHNIGHMVIESLTQKPLPQGIIAKRTGVFMNSSGEEVKKLITQYKLDLPSLWVVYDDLDIKLGEYKIQLGKGPKDHNGLNSIYENLDSRDFWHVRIGVDNRDINDRIPGERYVLEDFSADERKVLLKVIDEVCKKLATL